MAEIQKSIWASKDLKIGLVPAGRTGDCWRPERATAPARPRQAWVPGVGEFPQSAAGLVQGALDRGEADAEDLARIFLARPGVLDPVGTRGARRWVLPPQRPVKTGVRFSTNALAASR